MLQLPILFENGSFTDICDSRKGIYCWVNLTNNKKYVGIAAGNGGFITRLGQEISTIDPTKNSGTNLLSCAIRKYGLNNFVIYEIIELGDVDKQIYGSLESQFIKKFDAYVPNGYNQTQGGYGTIGHSSLGSREKRRGKPNHINSIKRAKKYRLISPDGIIHHIVNLTAFSLSNGFPPNALFSVVNGHTCSYRGWSIGKTKDDYAKSLSTTAYFISPDQEIVKVTNINRFTKSNGLSQAAFNRMWKTKNYSMKSKNWRCATEEEIEKFDNEKDKFWDFDHWVR